MSRAGNYNIELLRHSAYAVTFTFDYDISDLNFYSEIRDRKSVLMQTFAIVKDTANMSITMSLTENQIELMEIGEYYYDVKQVSLSLAYSIVIIEGKVIVKEGVTQIP